jgi:hypothetical protein
MTGPGKEVSGRRHTRASGVQAAADDVGTTWIGSCRETNPLYVQLMMPPDHKTSLLYSSVANIITMKRIPKSTVV